MEPAPPTTPVERLVGVYHADGTLLGELRYWFGARLGRAHCALCDITHGTFRAKPQWLDGRDGLGVPFETVHLDERAPDLAEATEGATPCVVALTSGGWVEVLGPDGLEERTATWRPCSPPSGRGPTSSASRSGRPTIRPAGRSALTVMSAGGSAGQGTTGRRRWGRGSKKSFSAGCDLSGSWARFV